MAYNYAAAKQAGLTDQEINNYLASKQPAQPTPEPQGGGLSSLLPLIGAIGGSFLPGLGTIAGGALGAGAGTLLKQGIQGKGDVGEVAKETALGGFGGVLGKATAPLFGGVSKLLGRGIAGAGENLATRAVRPSPSQYTGFLEKTGTTIGKFASKKGIVGKPAEQITETVIEPLQKSFDDIVVKSGVKVVPQNLSVAFEKRAAELAASDVPEMQARAKEILKIRDQLLKNYGDQPIDVSRLTKSRKEYDKLVTDFKSDPLKKTPYQYTRDSINDAIFDATEQAGLGDARQIGLELRDLYSFEKIAAKQEGLGKGTLPFGITRLGGALTGGAIGGAYGPEQGMGDNIRNALLGMGLVSAANNPRIISALAKGLIGGGEKLQAGGRLGGIIPQTLGQVGARGIGAKVGIPEAQAAEPALPQPLSATQRQQPNLTDILKMAALADLSKGGKNINEIIALSNFLNPPVGAATKTQLQQIEGAQTLVDQLESTYTQASRAGELGAFGKGSLSTLTGRITGGGIAGKALLYDNLREGFTALIARSTGERGVLTDADAARAKKLIPTANTTPEFAARQFAEIRKIFADAQTRIGGAGQWNFPLPQGGL